MSDIALRCAHGAICARSLECEHSDSASLDYVASGSTGRAKVQIIAVHKQKRDNREGYLSFVGGASLTKVEPLLVLRVLYEFFKHSSIPKQYPGCFG